MKKLAPQKKLEATQVVHFVQFGMAACMKKGLPRDWEENHRWASEWKHVNCPECLNGQKEVSTYVIEDNPKALGGKQITCKRCKFTSCNPTDVEQRFCANCNAFHDNMWPPARQWWLDHPERPNREEREAFAKSAYQTWCVTYGQKLGDWNALPARQQQCWNHVVQSIVAIYERTKQQG